MKELQAFLDRYPSFNVQFGKDGPYWVRVSNFVDRQICFRSGEELESTMIGALGIASAEIDKRRKEMTSS